MSQKYPLSIETDLMVKSEREKPQPPMLAESFKLRAAGVVHKPNRRPHPQTVEKILVLRAQGRSWGQIVWLLHDPTLDAREIHAAATRHDLPVRGFKLPDKKKAEADIGPDDRLVKAVVDYILRPGTKTIVKNAQIVTAAHRLFKTGSPELMAAEKYRNLAEIAAGAREEASDRSAGGSSSPWSRTPATELQLQAMQAVRTAHELTMRYNGARLLPMILVDGLSIDATAAALKVRNRVIKNGLLVILGILAASDSQW